MKKYLGEIALVLVLAMIFLVPMSVALRAERYQKAEREKISVIEAAEQKQEQEALKAINAIMHNYPTRSETMAENEIPKIARGTTGQAKVTGQYCSVLPSEWGLYNDTGGEWHGLPGVPESGWLLLEDGTVTVPVDAPAGLYSGYVWTERECPEEEDQFVAYNYEFEVVCFELEVGLVYNPASP